MKVRVVLPGGKPAPAGTQIALAAVDEALLELMPNRSWDLLDAMLQRRAYGVETSTAQMEIIGRRHFGRKAVPAGGGGGHSATRELFDTLLLWNPRVALDANGEASVEVPLNDALTSFRIVAIATVGAGQVRHRQHVDPQHAGPAADLGLAAARARRRSVPRAVHAAQHDLAQDEGRRDAACGDARPARADD